MVRQLHTPFQSKCKEQRKELFGSKGANKDKAVSSSRGPMYATSSHPR